MLRPTSFVTAIYFIKLVGSSRDLDLLGTFVSLSQSSQCVTVTPDLITDQNLYTLIEENLNDIFISDLTATDCVTFMDSDAFLSHVTESEFSSVPSDILRNVTLAVIVTDYDMIIVRGDRVYELWVSLSVSIANKTVEVIDLGPLGDVNLTEVILDAGDNLHGQTLTALFDDWSPYVLGDLDKGILLGGTVPEIFEVLAETLNFTPR